MTEQAKAELQRFKCHKVVEAMKITEMLPGRELGRLLVGAGDVAVYVDRAYVDKHHPEVGGYFVRYEDGYTSFSPAAVFEAGYVPFNPELSTMPPAKYAMTPADAAQLARVFTYHTPKDDQGARYVALRKQAQRLAETFLAFVPPGRERALAMTNLEESIMWANAGIARGE